MLNNCGRPSMGLYNFLDDQEDGYENVWECLDFPPKPEYESGQGVPPVWWLNIWVAYFFQHAAIKPDRMGQPAPLQSTACNISLTNFNARRT